MHHACLGLHTDTRPAYKACIQGLNKHKACIQRLNTYKACIQGLHTYKASISGLQRPTTAGPQHAPRAPTTPALQPLATLTRAAHAFAAARACVVMLPLSKWCMMCDHSVSMCAMGPHGGPLSCCRAPAHPRSAAPLPRARSVAALVEGGRWQRGQRRDMGSVCEVRGRHGLRRR